MLDTFTEKKPLVIVVMHSQQKQLQLCLKPLSFNKPVEATPVLEPSPWLAPRLGPRHPPPYVPTCASVISGFSSQSCGAWPLLVSGISLELSLQALSLS